MASIDVIFDRSTVYRLEALRASTLNVFARVSSQPHFFEDSRNHPIHGRNTSRRVFHAVLEGYNSPLRGAPFSPVQVAVKWVRGRQAVDRLRHEAKLYQNELRPLQGKVVPILYGCYAGNVEGVDVGCLVLEWCGGAINCSLEEISRKRILAACCLHAKGVEHGRLYDREGHHFVMGMDNTVRIIDFSVAMPHRCPGATPQLLGERPGDIPPGCVELEGLEARIGNCSPRRKLRRVRTHV
ncbi:hypothetical protein BC835DRAFT_1285323 [Cytidiella melzeri]|nr:hypothetical protein BC835DRAFT_1285323 [Cytidiella melzeri]